MIECCTACGASLSDRRVCYFQRARVCQDCLEDLSEGYEKIEAANKKNLANGVFNMLIASAILLSLALSIYAALV